MPPNAPADASAPADGSALWETSETKLQFRAELRFWCKSNCGLTKIHFAKLFACIRVARDVFTLHSCTGSDGTNSALIEALVFPTIVCILTVIPVGRSLSKQNLRRDVDASTRAHTGSQHSKHLQDKHLQDKHLQDKRLQDKQQLQETSRVWPADHLAILLGRDERAA